MQPFIRPSLACAALATAGPKSACGWPSVAKPPSSDGATNSPASAPSHPFRTTRTSRKESTAMPANVESMFSVREMPWHREGTLLADYPGDWDEARKLAGLDWDPVTTGVYAFNGVNPDGTLHYEPIHGWKCIMRSDTEAVLSINKDSYTVIDHGEMGEIVEAVLAQPNVKWETAGVLDGGRAVWCLALLDEPVELPGDTGPTLPYLAITNRHDGKAACDH